MNNLCATGEEQWCGLTTLGILSSFSCIITERCFTFLVSGVSSQINAQLNPLHIFIFNWVNLFLLSRSLLESIMAVLIGYSEKRCIGVSLRLQYFAFYFFYHTLTQTPSSVCNIRTKCQTVVHLATTQVLLWPLSPFSRVTCYPSPDTWEVPRETHTHTHTHTHQTESSLSFWNMCVSALISSLYIYLSLSYSLSQW